MRNPSESEGCSVVGQDPAPCPAFAVPTPVVDQGLRHGRATRHGERGRCGWFSGHTESESPREGRGDVRKAVDGARGAHQSQGEAQASRELGGWRHLPDGGD